jgi:ADP-dependent phosphofructokinase/glucokinase
MYSHWDSILRVDSNVLKWISNTKKSRPKQVLSSAGQAAFSLNESMTCGDTENLITEGLYRKLHKLFPKRSISLGGNGNNMGRALVKYGITPLVSYPSRPKRLMLACESFNIASKGRLVSPSNAVRKCDRDYDHIIFEHKNWRNIMAWDPSAFRGKFDEDFLRLALDKKSTDVALISYAHMLLPKFRKRTDHVLKMVAKSRPFVHLEFGKGNEESMLYAIEKFSEKGACDSWGMDESECMLYFKSGCSQHGMIQATVKACRDYGVGRICVHSPKFVFSVSRNSFRKESDALTAGCIAAAIEAGNLMVRRQKPKLRRIGPYNMCMVPTSYTPNPIKITGLGDVFTAISVVKSL